MKKYLNIYKYSKHTIRKSSFVLFDLLQQEQTIILVNFTGNVDENIDIIVRNRY